jgi:hypothetical protein
MDELEAGLEYVRKSPKDDGELQLIVRRPATASREVLEQGRLDPMYGLLGDNWQTRGSSRTPDGSAHRDMQLTIMNARLVALVAREKPRWELAGDQLYIDMDLSADNLPAGTHLVLGSATIEVTPQPHTGCAKFVTRFGVDAMKFVNSPRGRQLRLRGMYAKVVEPGVIHVGDRLRKIECRTM